MRLLATLSIVSLGGIFVPLGGLFISPYSSALSYQDSVDVEFTFNPSISVTVSGDLVIENLAPGSSSDSNIIDVSVATNNISGYVLTATAGNTSHTNTDLTKTGIENKFSSVATNADLSSITTDNTWGYSFSNNAGSSWTNYSGLPLYTAETGKELVSVDTNTLTPIKFKIAAKASTNQPTGTYTNVINFIAVANPEPELGPVGCAAGKICYQPNAFSGVVGTMGEQTATDGNTVMLLASNFSRTGYGFAGWSDVYDYNTNANAHFYGPQESITVPTGTTANGTSLYAVWVKSEGSLQDTNKVTSLCGTNGVGGSLITAPTDGTANLTSVSALTDQRDNQTYAIARLADNKCWMIENLRLENTATTGATNTALAQGYNSSFTGLANPESANFSNSTTANSLYSIDGSTENTISGDYRGFRFPRYNNFNTQQRAETPAINANTYSYGNYYTWHAAIADTTLYSTYNQSVTNTSICPTGWRLPKGGDKSNEANNEFWSLIVDGINGGIKPANYDSSTTPYYTGTPEGKDASTKLRSYPNNFLHSGDFGASSAYDRGSRGFYWSSTAIDFYRSYSLYLGSSGVDPGTTNNSRDSGQSIRCTAIGS